VKPEPTKLPKELAGAEPRLLTDGEPANVSQEVN
jgi:hypothetical protein